MYSYKSLLLLLLILFSFTSYSQRGPGGVGTNDGTSNLVLWLDASGSVSTTGAKVTEWFDLSGNGNDASAPTDIARPDLETADVNGYNSVHFDGQFDYLTVPDDATLDLTSWNFFIVTKADVNKNYNALFVKGLDAQENYEFLTFSDAKFHTPIDFTTGSRNYSDSSAGLYDTTNFDMYEYSFSNVGRDVYKNNTNIISDNESRTPETNNLDLYIGDENGTSRHLNGRISEFLIYDTPLNNAEKIIVQNYLSAKYGRPLTTNDFYTQDDSSAGNFDHDVAGIGRAADGSRHRDSRGTGIVSINRTNSGNDRFLFWGEETKDPTYNFGTNQNNYTEQLNSRWRVSNRGNFRAVNISFDISGIDLSGQNCRPLQLVIDNDYDFSSPKDVHDLTIDGATDTATAATSITFADGDYFTLRYIEQIVWDGTSFWNGSGTAGAPDATDDCLKLTIKPGTTATLSSDVHVREVEIEAGAKLVVNDGVLLEVEDVVVIDGEIDLVGEAQLIQNHTTTTSNSGDGFLKIRQQGTTNLYNHNYWSAPTNIAGFWKPGYLEDAAGVISFQSAYDANPATSPITLSSSWLHRFSGKSDNYWEWTAIATTTNLAPGLGYTMKGSGAGTTEQEYVFKGIPNDGDYAFPVTAGNDFLIGNPYPSTLDADQFINDNLSVIDGTLHFWEHFTTNNSHFLKDYQGGYATYNLMMALRAAAVPDDSGLTSGNGTAIKPIPTENIAVGQGFFVTIENTGTLVFNNAQRTFASESAGASIYYKGRSKKEAIQNEDTRTKIWFSFTDPKKINRTIGLGYDSKASKTYDRGYDAKYYEAQRNNIYWSLKGEKFIIQALEKIDIEDELPLLIEATDSGVYTFSINDMNYVPDSMAIYLKDTDQNLYYNLKEGDAQIYLSKSANHEQFSITFNKDNILKITDVANKKIFTSYDAETEELKLHGIDIAYDLQNVAIYNTLGQQIKTYKSLDTDTINLSGFNDGIYFLELNIENTKSTKSIKFIKN